MEVDRLHFHLPWQFADLQYLECGTSAEGNDLSLRHYLSAYLAYTLRAADAANIKINGCIGGNTSCIYQNQSSVPVCRSCRKNSGYFAVNSRLRPRVFGASSCLSHDEAVHLNLSPVDFSH